MITKKMMFRITYTIGLLVDGTWVITELDVGDGRACCITTLGSEVARSTLGTCRDAGWTIVDVGSEAGCKDKS